MVVAQLPASLIWTWLKDYDCFFDRDHEQSILLWVAHHKAKAKEKWDDRFRCNNDGSPKKYQNRHLITTSASSWQSQIEMNGVDIHQVHTRIFDRYMSKPGSGCSWRQGDIKCGRSTGQAEDGATTPS